MPTILVIGILRPDHGAYVDAWLALKEWANVGRRLNQKTPLARYVRATSLRYDPHWSALVHNTLWTQEALRYQALDAWSINIGLVIAEERCRDCPI